MMLVSGFNRFAAVEWDPERRSIKRILDVVSSERVAREQDVDITSSDQLAEVVPRRGVDDRRSSHQEVPTAAVATPAHPERGLPNRPPARSLARNGASHEPESRQW